MKHKLIKVLSLMMALTMLMGSLVLTVGATDCAHENENNEVVLEVPATCATLGYTIKKCADCGAEYTTGITDRAPHEYETKAAKDPTCSTPGNVEYSICKNCNEPEVGEDADYAIPATGNHNWELFVDEPGTGFYVGTTYDKTHGRLYKRCTMCGTEENVEIFGSETWGNNGHKFVYTITVAPTCITNGYATYSCAHCNQKWENIYVAPNATLGHSFTKDLHLESECVSKTANAKDYDVKVCEYCNTPAAPLPATIDCDWVKLGSNDKWTHDNGLEYQMLKDCVTDGYIVLKCSRNDCGAHKVYTPTTDDKSPWASYYDNFGTHEGHKMGTSTVQDGKGDDVYCSYYACTECSEKAPVDATHNWATLDSNGNETADYFYKKLTDHNNTATRDDDLFVNNNGTPNDATDDTEVAKADATSTAPNCYNYGWATVYCKDCAAVKVVKVNATGHKLDEYKCKTHGWGACNLCTDAEREVRCSNANCPDRDSTVIAVETHKTHGSAGRTVVTAPTCLTTGYTTQYCGQDGCGYSEKVEGSDTPKDPANHKNFVIKADTFSWAGTANDPANYLSYHCENATFIWKCACGPDEHVLDLYADYDFLVEKLANETTLATVKAVIGDSYFTGTGLKTLKPADTFKGRGHLNYQEFKPNTHNAKNKLGLLSTDYFGADAYANSNNNMLVISKTLVDAKITQDLTKADNNAYTTDTLTITDLKPVNATCGEIGSTGGSMCVRCGKVETAPAAVAVNTTNHRTASNAFRENIAILTYTPANCVNGETITFNCACGAKNVKLTNAADKNAHWWYEYNANFDAAAVTGATTAEKIANLKGADYLTVHYDNRVFTGYKPATCTTAGNHANLYCTLCEKAYSVSNDKTLKEMADTNKANWTALTVVGKGTANECPIVGCSCKAADGTSTWKVVGDHTKIPVEIPAINHYGLQDKIFNTVTPVKKVAKQDATCIADGWVEYKYCDDCKKIVDEGQTDADNAYMKGVKAAAKVPAHGDANWVFTAAKAPTCTQNGVAANMYCSVCKTTYKNAKSTSTLADVVYTGNNNPSAYITNYSQAENYAVIGRLNHTLSTPEYFHLVNGVWTATTTVNTTSCTESYFTVRYCTRPTCDGFNAIVDYNGDKHVQLTATASEAGYFIYDFDMANGHVFADPNLPTAEQDADFVLSKDAVETTGENAGRVFWKDADNVKHYTNVYYYEYTGADKCTKGAYFYTKCTTCTVADVKNVVKTVAGEGHKDYQGNVLADNCTNNGKTCYNCNTALGTKCTTLVYVLKKAATHHEDGIALYACTLCGKEYADKDATTRLTKDNYDAMTKIAKGSCVPEIITVFAETYVAPTYEAAGSIKVLCKTCGETTIVLPKLTNSDIYYSINAYNPTLGVLPADTKLPLGGMIKVSLMMNTGMEYNALTLDIAVPTSLELVDYEFSNDYAPLLAVKNSLSVNANTAAYNNLKIMSVVTGSDKANIVIDGEKTVFVDLYFKVLAVNGTTVPTINFNTAHDDVDVYDAVTDAQKDISSSVDFVRDFEATIVATKLFDANNNTVVDQGDMIAMVGDLVAGVVGDEVKYNAAADLDRDGKVTIKDLQYLEKYLLTEQKFADYVNVYVLAITDGKVTLADKIAATDLSDYDWDVDGKFGTPADARAFAEDVYEAMSRITSGFDTVPVEYYVDNLIEFVRIMNSPI